MTEDQLQPDWQKILKTAGPYPLEAYNFVREGLSYTALRTHKNIEAIPESDRHVSGQQLCIGLRDFAIEQYGMLAPTVLNHWHIRRTDDLGRIVFAMIDAGLMTKTDADKLDDFRSVYDFKEAFSDHELVDRIGRN